MFDPQRPAWQNPRVHGILLLVFLSGAVFGALVMRLGMNYRVTTHSNSSIGKGLSYDRLTKDLQLSPDQCAFGEDIKAAGGDWAVWRPRDWLSGDIETQLRLLKGQPTLPLQD